MQSRDARFWLLFESGPRDGERVPLSEETFSLGRSESNELVLAHASVSAAHAEFRIQGNSVLLRDAGSRNGTRVDGQKIEEQQLGHGDVLQFGAVRARFQDARFAGDDQRAPTDGLGGSSGSLHATQGAADHGAAGSALGTVNVDVLARSNSRSKVWLLLVVVALGGLGFIGWRTFGTSGSREQRKVLVASVAGNLLASPSFEEDASATWSSAEAASQAFFVDSGFSASGEFGLGVQLAEGEWALAHSEVLRLRDRKAVELSASLRVNGEALARTGLELSTQDDSEPRIRAWSPAVQGGAGDAAGAFRSVQLGFRVPLGYTRGRVLVAAKAVSREAADGEAEVALDDVSVVTGTSVEPNTVTFEEYELTVLGAGGSTAILARSGRVLFTGISLSRWDASGLEGWSASGWTPRRTETGFLLELDGTPPAGTRCELVAFHSRPLSVADSGTPWIATFGDSGYRSHSLIFERKGATDLLLGGGANMLRMRTQSDRLGKNAAPKVIRGLARGENAVLSLAMGSATGLEIQLSFDEERAAAERLALEARSAAAAGESGAALSIWGELLDRWAFDAELIAEGETVRAALLRAGHTRLEELQVALDRADFFRLRDGYLRCLGGVRELGADFEGTELQAKAEELEERIAYALDSLAADHAGSDVQRLQGVLAALKGSEESALFAHVRALLARHLARHEGQAAYIEEQGTGARGE